VFLAYFLAVAEVSDFAGLGLVVVLTYAVFADQVGGTSVGCIAEVAFAPKDAVALLGDVGVQGDGCAVGEFGGCGEVFGPVEVAACRVGPF
jgi:hypothetical protein